MPPGPTTGTTDPLKVRRRLIITFRTGADHRSNLLYFITTVRERARKSIAIFVGRIANPTHALLVHPSANIHAYSNVSMIL